MKQIIQKHLNKQQGAASLVTAIMLLISITLVVLLTAKTVATGIKMSADSYRTTQAVAAANSAMDYAMDYLKAAGFDQDSSGAEDILAFPDLVAHADYGGKTTTATITFDTTETDCIGLTATASMDAGQISVTGFSDDTLASRTITQCVGPLNLLRDDGPDQPLVSRGSITATGNAHIINRYTNTTIWSGDAITITGSMETYIKNSTAGTLTTEQELDNATSPVADAQLVSNKNLGLGLDIIDDDPSLKNLIGIDFFKNFFEADTRDDVMQEAIDLGQYYLAADIANADGKAGFVWIEGDATLTGGTFGVLPTTASPDSAKPVVLIINGDLATSGNPVINGLLYVAGTLTIGGNPVVRGSTVVEGTSVIGADPEVAATPAVSGTGAIDVIYWPAFKGAGDGTLTPGKATAVSGSWKDWQ